MNQVLFHTATHYTICTVRNWKWSTVEACMRDCQTQHILGVFCWLLSTVFTKLYRDTTQHNTAAWHFTCTLCTTVVHPLTYHSCNAMQSWNTLTHSSCVHCGAMFQQQLSSGNVSICSCTAQRSSTILVESGLRCIKFIVAFVPLQNSLPLLKYVLLI